MICVRTSKPFLHRPFPAGDRAPERYRRLAPAFFGWQSLWDNELLELLSLCLLSARMEASKQKGELKEFYTETVGILVTLQNEARRPALNIATTSFGVALPRPDGLCCPNNQRPPR